MSTRSNIGIKRKDGSVSVIYCHWDGYLSYNGQILLDNYKLEDVKELVSRGNMSGLSKDGVDSCSFYDGDDEVATHYNSLEEYFDSVKDDIFIEFAYIFDEDMDSWTVAFYEDDADGQSYHFTEFRELTQELIDRENGV